MVGEDLRAESRAGDVQQVSSELLRVVPGETTSRVMAAGGVRKRTISSLS